MAAAPASRLGRAPPRPREGSSLDGGEESPRSGSPLAGASKSMLLHAHSASPGSLSRPSSGKFSALSLSGEREFDAPSEPRPKMSPARHLSESPLSPRLAMKGVDPTSPKRPGSIRRANRPPSVRFSPAVEELDASALANVSETKPGEADRKPPESPDSAGLLRRSLKSLASVLTLPARSVSTASSGRSAATSTASAAEAAPPPRSLLRHAPQLDPDDAIFVDTALVLVPETLDEFAADQLAVFRSLIGRDVHTVENALFLLGQSLHIFPQDAKRTDLPYRNILLATNKLSSKMYDFLVTLVTKHPELGFVLVGGSFAQVSPWAAAAAAAAAAASEDDD